LLNGEYVPENIRVLDENAAVQAETGVVRFQNDVPIRKPEIFALATRNRRHDVPMMNVADEGS
jgi:hypothetical protein